MGPRFMMSQPREVFQKTGGTDIELPNTPENFLDVWQDIMIGLI